MLLVLNLSVNKFPTATTQSQNWWRQIRTTDNSVAESPRGMLFHINNSNTQDVEGRQGGVGGDICVIHQFEPVKMVGYWPSLYGFLARNVG